MVYKALEINISMSSNEHLKRMYTQAKATQAPASNTANPNRVAGGLRGQGVDHYSILGEDGLNREVPTKKYVDALEQQLNAQKQLVEALIKKVNRQNNDIQATQSLVRTLSNRISR
jgi:uncharacterized coiled-coil protein SlyX